MKAHMHLNLNLTLSIIIGKGMSADDMETALLRLDEAVTHCKGRYGVTIQPTTQSAPTVNVDANKAYLQAHGKGRTPIVSDTELALRVKLPATDWTNLQARREALLTLSYDVFDVNRDKAYADGTASTGDAASVAFTGELSDEVGE